MKSNWLIGLVFIFAGILVLVWPQFYQWVLGIGLIVVGVLSFLKR